MLAYLPGLLAPLLFLAGFMLRGRRGGTGRPSASITTRVPGTQTPETATTAGCSSPFTHGVRLVASSDRIWRLRGSSYGAPFWFTDVTDLPGGNGVQRDYAD